MFQIPLTVSVYLAQKLDCLPKPLVWNVTNSVFPVLMKSLGGEKPHQDPTILGAVLSSPLYMSTEL